MEGVVKYNITFNKSKALKRSLVNPIETCRERLYAMGLVGAYPDGIGYGNISQRTESEAFVITGTQTGHLSNLTPRYYSLVEECDDRSFSLKASGAVKPSSEALTHGTIYGLDDKIRAVIHIHSMSLWKFMLSGQYLRTKNVEYGTTQMIEEVERIYRDINPLEQPLFAMAGHEEGIVCFAESIKEAELVLLALIDDYLG